MVMIMTPTMITSMMVQLRLLMAIVEVVTTMMVVVILVVGDINSSDVGDGDENNKIIVSYSAWC